MCWAVFVGTTGSFFKENFTENICDLWYSPFSQLLNIVMPKQDLLCIGCQP